DTAAPLPPARAQAEPVASRQTQALLARAFAHDGRTQKAAQQELGLALVIVRLTRPVDEGGRQDRLARVLLRHEQLIEVWEEAVAQANQSPQDAQRLVLEGPRLLLA